MSANPILIRDATPADAPTIAEFNVRMAMETEHLKLDPPTVLAGVRAVLSDPSRGRYFVADINGTVAGQLLITHEWSDWRNADIWWIESVYVHPDYRRAGVFRTLYDQVRAIARNAGACALRLYVERENLRAQNTYKSLGMDLTHYLVMEEMLK
jgi:ribosomal protein S18 acetylase RimI-like enzyme